MTDYGAQVSVQSFELALATAGVRLAGDTAGQRLEALVDAVGNCVQMDSALHPPGTLGPPRTPVRLHPHVGAPALSLTRGPNSASSIWLSKTVYARRFLPPCATWAKALHPNGFR